MRKKVRFMIGTSSWMVNLILVLERSFTIASITSLNQLLKIFLYNTDALNLVSVSVSELLADLNSVYTFQCIEDQAGTNPLNRFKTIHHSVCHVAKHLLSYPYSLLVIMARL